MEDSPDFFTNFTLEEELGNGACSVVYQCRQRNTGNRFAAKVCDKSNSDYVTLLQRERLLLSKLDHKNIIKCEGLYRDIRDQVYTVLELVDGGELNEVVNEFGAFSERDGQCIAYQLLQAITYIHSVNMIHRDIKLENILVTDKGVVKLADFGLAIHTHPEDPTVVGCVGTHSYQAPEILMNIPYTNSVDMWAWGVSIYVLLSAKKPFPKEGTNRALQRSKILNGEYDFYGEAWRHISDDAKDLISKAIQIRPNDRITAEEALEHPWMKSPVINLKTFGERWASKLELSRRVNSKKSTVSRSGRTEVAPSREDRARANNASRVTQSRPERSQASLYSHRNTPTTTRTTERAERSQASIYSYHRSVEPSRTTDRGTTSTHSRILQS